MPCPAFFCTSDNDCLDTACPGHPRGAASQLARMESRQALAESADLPIVSSEGAISAFEWGLIILFLLILAGFLAGVVHTVLPILRAAV